MATNLDNIINYDLVSEAEYVIKSAFYMLLIKDVTADVTVAFKATDTQGFVDQEAITESKVVFIPNNVEFKATFADGTVTISKLNGYGGL